MINFSAVRPETLAGKIVRYPFRVLPRDIVMPILQGPLRGKKWIVGSHLHGCWLGSYEWEMQKRMAKEVRPGMTFYDIGANVGFYSLLAAKLVGSGRVYAMEPLASNLAYLRRHLELNRVRNVEVMEMALSDEVGKLAFESEGTRAMGRIGAAGTTLVESSTIDFLLEEGKIDFPDCIKMDIEGTEYRALAAARECFARHRPKLFLALHGKGVHENCCRLLSSWGYDYEYMSHESEERAEIFAFRRTDGM